MNVLFDSIATIFVGLAYGFIMRTLKMMDFMSGARGIDPARILVMIGTVIVMWRILV